MSIIKQHLPARCVTPAEGHYFFGYFDKSPWDPAGKRLLANHVDFVARQPRFGDKAELGIIEDGKFSPVAVTDIWNWQQGCMLQWFSQDEIIYNDFENDHYVARILNLVNGRSRTLHRPIYCLSPDRRYALSLDFARLDRERPGYGYTGIWHPLLEDGWPAEDGLYLIDIEKDTSKLIVSIAETVERFPYPGMTDATNWFNHLLFSPDGRRISFFHRWRVFGPWGPRVRSQLTHMFTADIDGANLYALNLEEMSSHYVWVDNSHIINYSNRFSAGYQYYLYTDQSPTNEVKVIARDVFPGDGHCTWSPDHRWMLTDCYPQADNCRNLYLYDMVNEKAYEIGKFYSDPAYPTPTRCDLHPRFSADGKTVCFDSIHEGHRGVYLMDVSPIVG